MNGRRQRAPVGVDLETPSGSSFQGEKLLSIIEFLPIDRSSYKLVDILYQTRITANSRGPRSAHRAHVLICQGNANPLIRPGVNDSRTLTVGEQHGGTGGSFVTR